MNRNTNNIFIASLLIISLTLLCLAPLAGAAQLDNVFEEKEEVDQKINETQSKIEQKEKEKNQTLAELNSINRSMEKASDEIEQYEKDLEITEEKINLVSNEIVLKEKDLATRTSIFQNRLCQIYQQGDVNILEVLFQSASISDFLTRFEYLKAIADNDTKLLKELEAERVVLDAKKKNLDETKQQLLALKKSREDKQHQLQIASTRRQTLVKKIEQQKDSYERMLDELEEQSKELETKILALQSNSGTRPSFLMWPTPGYYRITSPYGMRYHPILKTQKFHQGVDIASPYGSPIKVSAPGTVIYTGYSGGYGHTVIVDHGGGMTTLHAHLSKYLVKVGAKVNTGDAIGKIGTSGWSTGPHLHFEVRINGKHVDPMPYLKK